MSEARIFYQEDCNLSLLDGKTIAIIGYGSQGHAHALNLKESGCNVIIGLYEGSKSWKKAEEQGFKVYVAAEAAKKADIIMILINDDKQAKLYMEDMSLSVVCKYLERWYDVEITLQPGLGEKIRYNGVIQEETVTDVMDALSRLSNISYHVKGKHISITSK